MNTYTLYFNQGKLKFSAGHFTIFSETDRETLHGHNYTIELVVTAREVSPGITFDYRLLEARLLELAQQLHLHCLIPAESPYLEISDDDPHVAITFNKETMWLLKKDVMLLPLKNISLETLSQWFVSALEKDHAFLSEHAIQKIVLKVFNGPYNGAEAVLTLEEG